MTEAERLLPAFRFPEGCDEATLVRLQERVSSGQSLRVAVTHHLQEEGLALRNAIETLRPDDSEAKIAVNEYTLIGSLILETESAIQSGYITRGTQLFRQERLLKKDPSGFVLLDWWGKRRPRNFKRLLGREKEAVLVGRSEGVRRYKELYRALLQVGVSQDH